jgi:hypothetical protein
LDSSQDEFILLFLLLLLLLLLLQTPSDVARRTSLGLVATITHSPLIGNVPMEWDRKGRKRTVLENEGIT